MQRKSFLFAVLAAAVSAAVVAAVSFAASDGSTTKTVTFKLTEKGQVFNYVDNPPTSKGHVASAGDMFVFSSELLTPGGKRAGHLDAYCVVTRGGKGEVSECTGTFSLAGGQLHGIVNNKGEQNVTKVGILGGTGAYQGAQGTIVSVSRPNSNISHDTVTLQLP